MDAVPSTPGWHGSGTEVPASPELSLQTRTPDCSPPLSAHVASLVLGKLDLRKEVFRSHAARII